MNKIEKIRQYYNELAKNECESIILGSKNKINKVIAKIEKYLNKNLKNIKVYENNKIICPKIYVDLNDTDINTCINILSDKFNVRKSLIYMIKIDTFISPYIVTIIYF